MANEISGKIPKKWQTDLDQVKQFTFGMEGADGYTYYYQFGRTGQDVPYLLKHIYEVENSLCVTVRLPTRPTSAIEILTDELKQSKRNPPLPLSTLALFYVISLAHYKMCCVQLGIQCRKKLQHQTAIDYVCDESNEYNHIYNMLVQKKKDRIEKRKQRDERREMREWNNRIHSRFEILDL